MMRHSFQGNMSRKANCWDALVMEHVWRRQYASHTVVIRDVTDYIVNFYNNRRLHSSFGYLSPNSCELKMAGQQPIGVSEKS